jgi:hypothetical protein
MSTICFCLMKRLRLPLIAFPLGSIPSPNGWMPQHALRFLFPQLWPEAEADSANR